MYKSGERSLIQMNQVPLLKGGRGRGTVVQKRLGSSISQYHDCDMTIYVALEILMASKNFGLHQSSKMI